MVRTLCLYCLPIVCTLFGHNFAQANDDTGNTRIEQAEPFQAKILLAEKVSFIRPAPTWFTYPQEYGLMPGEYEESSRNKDGIFYQGKGRSVWFQNPESKKFITAWPGGLFVPFDANKPARMYKVDEGVIYRADWETYQTAHVSMQPFSGSAIMPAAVGAAVGFLIVDAIVAAGKGNIYLFDEVADDSFNQKIMDLARTVQSTQIKK
ncbi:MAG: hypothetical protein EOP50_01085 [Sphingobacteriales bacterium]|nr:MAG: hypothetical protein EOP50_01085 [Sphingobacteriales bacterium]